MSTADIEYVNNAVTTVCFTNDWNEKSAVYRCSVCIVPEDDGAYSAIVLNLPGVGSCGDTEEEALANVREAILGAIASYAARGEAIPWTDEDWDGIPENARRERILVNVQ
jgi:predicted RNase H-like HicB family nuclease